MNRQEDKNMNMKKFGCAVILAGGRSSRMGFDKQFLKINEKRIMDTVIDELKQEFSEIVIVTNKPEDYKGSPYRIVCDEMVGKGPLSGIHAGLKNCSSEYAYFIGCDMPVVNLKFIRYMKQLLLKSNADSSAAEVGGRIEPFSAFYSKSILDKIEDYISSESKSMFSFIKTLNCDLIEESIAREFDENLYMFLNLNTKEDLGKYINLRNGSFCGGIK